MGSCDYSVLRWRSGGLEMLTCIACSKQVSGRSLHEQEEGEGEAVATPSTKHAIKALTAQVME